MGQEEIAAESIVLKSLNKEQRQCLAGIAAASLPDDDLQDNMWNSTLFLVIIRALSLDEDQAMALELMTPAGQAKLPESDRTTWDVRASAFASDSEIFAVDSSSNSEVSRRSMIRDLLAIVVLSFGYDARARSFFRRMAWALQIPWAPYMRDLESELAHALYREELAVLDSQKTLKKRDPWRYAKIGLCTVAGGTILAVTGGLAAPALAAGLLSSGALIGGAVGTAAVSLAAFSTTAIVATLFGVGGAGLVGYKFNRRIASIGEFKFVAGAETHEMGVAICIPGILAERGDLHRVWGSDFVNSYFKEEMIIDEVLKQYFFVVDPSRIDQVPNLVRTNKNCIEDLCKTLQKEYGLNPLAPLTYKDVKEWKKMKYGGGSTNLQESTDTHDLEMINQLIRVAFKADDVLDTKDQNRHIEEEATSANTEGGGGILVNDESEQQNPETGGAKMKTTEEINEQIATGLDFLCIQNTTAESSSTLKSKEEQMGNMKVQRVAFSNCASFEPDISHSTSANEEEEDELLLVMSEEEEEDRTGSGGRTNVLFPDCEVAMDNLCGSSRDDYYYASDDSEETYTLLKNDKKDKDSPKDTMEAEESDKWKWRVWFWEETYPCNDQFLLQWEVPMLLELGKSVRNIVSKAGSMMAQEMLKYTLLSAIMAAVALPLTLISLCDLIDTDWSVAVKKAELAGKILASVLLERPQGCRPVTLIASSIGAQVVLSCLEELSRRQELWDEATKEDSDEETGKRGRKKKKSSLTSRKYKDARSVAGLIDDVIILGGAVCVNRNAWSKTLRIVHGRFINGYCPGDWVLGLIYRAKLLSINVAGLQSVSLPGIYNVGLTSTPISNQYDFTKPYLPEALDAVEQELEKSLPP